MYENLPFAHSVSSDTVYLSEFKQCKRQRSKSVNDLRSEAGWRIRMRDNCDISDPAGQQNNSRSDGNFSEVENWLQLSLRRYPPFDRKLRDQRDHMYGTIPIPSFSGLPSESPKLFFSQFEKYIEYLQITDEETIKVLGCVLKKDALECFDVLTN